MEPIFDPRLVRLRKARAADAFDRSAFLHARVAEDLAERIESVNRRFDLGLALGAPDLLAALRRQSPSLTEKIGALVGADWVAALAGAPGFVCDLDRMPLAPTAFDVVASNLMLHHANDLLGALIQIRLALKPDGMFVGAMFGAETLKELRLALISAESEIVGGAAARVSPFATAEDLTSLLQRAGFAMPVVDTDIVTVRYGDPKNLFVDLRAMGETNVLRERSPSLKRAALARALDLYAGSCATEDGRLPATFEIITATGWSPPSESPTPYSGRRRALVGPHGVGDARSMGERGE